MKKIIILYIEYVITVFIYAIPASIIIEILNKIFENSRDILIIIGVFIGLAFFSVFKPFLSKTKVVPKIIDKLIK